MATVGQMNIKATLEGSKVKRQKVLKFAKKQHAKRITSFPGFVAKLQQSLVNKEEQFVYYVTKKILPFVDLLREVGVIHNFSILPQLVQDSVLRSSLGPGFDARVLVVYLKTSDKYAAALGGLKTFTIPSRQVTISHSQLLTKTLNTKSSTLYILNTPLGLLTHTAALSSKTGGEVVCEIR